MIHWQRREPQATKELEMGKKLRKEKRLSSVVGVGRPIDLFSWYILFSDYRSRGDTLDNSSCEISTTARVYVGINYENTKQNSLGNIT